MAAVAASFFDHPARSMTMVGVTGTNGKTTVTHLVRSILEHDGRSAATIGTLDGERTTPEAPALQRRLAELRASGHQAVAMEVSSHALSQHRADGIVFDVAAFTNLSRDHLDHHGTMEEYFAAKTQLFEPRRCRSAVINVDDPWGARLAGSAPGTTVVPVRRGDARDIELSVGRSSFRWRGRRVTVPLTGVFNVDNALLAATVCSTLGVDEDAVVGGLAGADPVPGRMEVVTAGPPVTVFVDYAHTPAGLDAVLATARELAGRGRVICLFGCGGDRDRGKRPEMGAVAARRADRVVLTSDNPRNEDPGAIIDDVLAGLGDAVDRVVEVDRSRAITAAIASASPGDVVVIAGKGHETTQTTGSLTRPFDDADHARRALAARAADGLRVGSGPAGAPGR
jgi:UDP-N-acetylmuramoyl-L-alanyl-D-glutamate--2,6-diaminopimelate ligase